jgi:hypothetical protein
MSLFYKHQQCLDTINKVAAFEAGLDEFTRGLCGYYNPGLEFRRGTLDLAQYGKNVLRPEDFQSRTKLTTENGATFHQILLTQLRRSMSLPKAKKAIKTIHTGYVSEETEETDGNVNNLTYDLVSAHVGLDQLNSILAVYIGKQEINVLGLYVSGSHNFRFQMASEIGMRATPEWIAAVKERYTDTEAALERAQGALDKFEEESPGYHDAACAAIVACAPYNVQMKRTAWAHHPEKTGIAGVDLKTPKDFELLLGRTYFVSSLCRQFTDYQVNEPLVSKEEKEVRKAAAHAIRKYTEISSTRRELKKRFREAREAAHKKLTYLKLIQEFHNFPEAVAPLTDPSAFMILGQVALHKQIVLHNASCWLTPPNALSRFREAIIAADKTFLKTRRENGTLTKDPFYIELHCENQRCTINGKEVPVPHCKIRVEGFSKRFVVIEFVEDVYDGMYRLAGYKEWPTAVCIRDDGSAVFRGKGKIFHDLLELWNSEPELTVSEILGVSKGRCIFCHRALSVGSSKEQGFGDICKKKFQESIVALRGTIEHSVNKDADVVAGVDVQPSKKTKVQAVKRLNGHEIPEIVMMHSSMLKTMAEDFEDVSEKIEGLLGVDGELLEILASWLNATDKFLPSRAAEVIRLCHKLDIPFRIDGAKPLITLSL